MRTLTDHIVPGDSANHQLTIEVHDEPGADGACHEYLISTDAIGGGGKSLNNLAVSFQNGPIKEVGVNGVTHEALLAIVIDRLRSFQQGPYECSENQVVLCYLEAALTCLQRRTVARMNRGVEGTHEK